MKHHSLRFFSQLLKMYFIRFLFQNQLWKSIT